MGKLLASAIGGLFAIMVVMAMGQPAWAQEKQCDASKNPSRCSACYADAGDNNPQGQCECLCKWLTPKDMSKPECLAEVCGTESGGVGSKISQGPVFRGDVYPSIGDALVAANTFVLDHDLVDNVQVVMRDFFRITRNSDSWLIHLVGEPYIPPDCSGSEGGCVVLMGNFQCSAGINQDGNPFLAGCQSGIGCYEVPKSRWVQAGCPTTMGCCSSESGCPARSGGPDTAPANGFYGTDGAGCGIIP